MFQKLVKHRTLLLGIIGVLLLIPFYTNIGTYITVDETLWVTRVEKYWSALLSGDIKGTYQGSKPAVTLLWLGGLGKYIATHLLNIDSYLGILTIQRVLVVTLSLSLVGLLAWHISRLNKIWALATAFLILTEPQFIGMSKLLHMDALLSLLMINVLFSYIAYLDLKKNVYAFMCTLLFGGALLTKVPAFFLFGFLPLVLLILSLQSDHPMKYVKKFLLPTLAIFISAFILYVLFWPVLVMHFDYVLAESRDRLGRAFYYAHTTDYTNAQKDLFSQPFFYITAALTSFSATTVGLFLAYPLLLIKNIFTHK